MSIRYIQVEQDTVINAVVGTADEISSLPGTWQPNDTAQLGDVWDGTEFVTPSAPAVEPRMRLSVREFREQFTLAEKQAIYTAAKNNVDLEIFLDDLRSVEFVDLDFQQTIDSVIALETVGLIGPGRAAEILGGV